jgi:quercetin dioxygenase-like cupin family protein
MEELMPRFQDYKLSDLEKAQADAGKAYKEFLRRPNLSMGLYHLPTGGQDPQHPHDADEVYVVLRGSATLRIEDEDHEVGNGSVVSVDRGVEHKFVNISDDLLVLVVFAPPESPE